MQLARDALQPAQAPGRQGSAGNLDHGEVAGLIVLVALFIAYVARFKVRIGIAIEVEAVPLGALPRSEKKTKRVVDKRYC